MPGHRITAFTIETQQAGQSTLGWMMTVGAVSNRLSASLVHKLQDRTLLISRKQCGFQRTVNTPLLGQQQIVVLKDRTP
ncbi:hypothetical protein ALQ16_200227 [Pseudomonas syringae pv. actinidiae]|nr:hypothetical protein A259_08044 [Pseudomonas syringae pv. actinidiae ICMP 19070]RMP88823.1 hypothetical protein ALQ16_200227 [Pseudomonas syringae pv. actinidiae]